MAKKDWFPNRRGQRLLKMGNHPAYHSWRGAWRRCNDPAHHAHKWYAEHGIAVCERWRLFEHFWADMGPEWFKGATLERVDNAAGYSPDNCVWATRKTQARNTRQIRLLTANGKTQCLSAWAEETGIGVSTLWRRLKRGWSEEKAITTPVEKPQSAVAFSRAA